MSSTPHDALFKATFSDPAQARGELRAALPASIAERLDWPTLALHPGSFVDPALTYRHTDLLFTVRSSASADVLVYLLFEHQSSSDPMMAFRLLCYLVRIWERWCAEHPDARSLPAIIPLVLHHGDAPWSAPLSFSELIHGPRDFVNALAPYLVDFRYRVDDLVEVSDAELRRREAPSWAVLTTLSLKHARRHPDIVALLVDCTDLLLDMFQAPNGADTLSGLMRYILLVNEHVTAASLGKLMGQQLGPAAKDIIMTEGERLIAQGMERGMAQGMERGMARGREQGRRDALLDLLRQRFGESAVAGDAECQVMTASMSQLERWMARIFAAVSLRDVFDDEA